ncbi:MAG: molybdopterin-dependent oxidoreductase [Mesorhizobium sp.]|nr:molybdopterin-dependent oxidoreductase [Mesorhizobium sp.]
MHEARPVRTTCPYCGVGCGVLAEAAADVTSVRGDPDHPANLGRLCSKGSALAETMGLHGRLLHPEIGGKQAGWEAALDLIAGRFAETIARHGADSVAFYVSGQLLTEDYYVANKLMKGFIGSGNIDTNSRLCMASSVAGHRRAFGEDIVPGIYEDFDAADLIVLVGSNTAWCHPVLYQRMLASRRARGTRIVVVDPRRTATASDCDLHLALKAGSDVLLFNGLLAHLARAGVTNDAFIANHTNGFSAALALAEADAPSVAHVAEGCGLAAENVAMLYGWFAATERTVTVYSQGVNQSAHGTDKVNAIINCHLATGRIGRPGAGPFSVTGQPNAMGGREVGGLANQLAAHMAFDDPGAIERVGRFWNAPAISRHPGLKAVDMFDAVADGRIKALWVIGTNPAVSMPNAKRVRRGLKQCDFVVVSDVVRTDTTRFADVLLPAAAWGEKDGTVTNSERRISRQRGFSPLPGEARPDWWAMAQVAHRMGFGTAFPYVGPAEIFREHAALSAFENGGTRLFDLGGVAGLSDADYQTLEPVRWPVRTGDAAGAARLLGDGGFPSADGRAHFVAVRQEGPAIAVDATHPIALNTGRLRDQWHTMTRTGAVPRLMSHAPEPMVDLHPADASLLGLADGDFARLDSRFGRARAKVRITSEQRQGDAFLPMHWSGQFAAGASTGSLSNPATDPFSGQPELKHVPVRIVREAIAWAGFFVTRRDLRPTGFIHWSRRAIEGGWLHELAGPEPGDQGILLGQRLLDPGSPANRLDYSDKRNTLYRAAVTDRDGRLSDALFVGRPGSLPERHWLLSLFGSPLPIDETTRRALLSGRAATPTPSVERIVCSCFNVGLNQIADAAAAGCASVDDIGIALKAGTNCGSCRAEIRGILDEGHLQAAE